MHINLWFLLERSKELAETWVVHCLELDVVSYGKSPEEALRMGQEAARMVLADDMQAGLNPMERRAPPEDWEKLYQLLRAPQKKFPVAEMDRHQSEVNIYAVLLVVPLPQTCSVPVPAEADDEESRKAILAA